jgi:hypothetical protein
MFLSSRSCGTRCRCRVLRRVCTTSTTRVGTSLAQLGLAIPDELKQFTVMVNWPRLVVDAVEQRLDVTGFRMPGSDSADSALWDVWQYNNMDERAGFAHTDALAIGRSYVCVGTNDEDSEYPLMTVESPYEMVAIRDPRTHRVTAGLRMYGQERTSMGQSSTTVAPCTCRTDPLVGPRRRRMGG